MSSAVRAARYSALSFLMRTGLALASSAAGVRVSVFASIAFLLSREVLGRVVDEPRSVTFVSASRIVIFTEGAQGVEASDQLRRPSSGLRDIAHPGERDHIGVNKIRIRESSAR